ncbi:hypothetical protein LAZ67_11001902 [Cordylochernes scorpioides]|uniref:Endonuclease n=1 Tax=Cordylochernes scorpioides TaxID=51811 RepID=A0ABY6KYS0_9ARAC|nr:hypothetical protein LAZ67_11001902 [Cordylochernes scorpioides]
MHCKSCNKRHHTLLHSFQPEPLNTTSIKAPIAQSSVSCFLSDTTKPNETILLSTAIVRVRAENGSFHPCRALIDTGSQRSLITENCREKLNLPVKKSQLTVFGIGNQPIQQSARKLRFQNHPGPSACSSKLGWILSGNVSSSETGNSYISLCSTSQGDDNLRKFFEWESVPAALPLTKEEKNSRHNAMKRFLALERKLHKSSNLLQQYKDFMMEYLSLNHMELIPKNERDKPSDKCYYIPHHCVLRDQSSTTKLRVVFDSSCKTSNNYSLNDFLHTEPKLQHDIFNYLVKFRTNPIAFTGDIEKIESSGEIVHWNLFLEYRLLTVTYGMSCAPYLAIRTLMQLATDKELLFPEASKILKTDFYVDDLLSGATTIEEAKVLIDDIRRILLSGGFCIRKWMSNVPEVLSEVPEALKAHDSYEIVDNSSVKILGINWNPSTDNFTITANSLKDVYSKRQLLSDISRIYDPLGWLSPVIISFKILFQTLWKQDLNWREPLSESLCSHWRRVKMDLAMLNHIKIPRYISCKGLIHSLELHGFCDASESAYSSVVYMKSRFKSGHVQVTLIAAKTKVAPLKATLFYVGKKSESKHWKPFVGNRIAEIQRLTLQSSWYYVSTKDNPADCASRGITSSELVNHSLWWNGPDWLSNSSLQDPLPITYELPKEVCHEKRKTVPIVHFTTCPILDLNFKFSTFRKLSRVTAWLLRFIHNARHSSDKIKHTELSSNELDNSIRTLIQIIQSSEFKTEIQCFNQSKVLPTNSKLLSLNPFIDSSGILRVGGRLRKSNLQFNEKHPIILPHNHFVTKLIVQQFNVEHLHSGLQLTLCAIRQKYWIPSGRILVKKLINRCMTCFKTKRQVLKQIMGDLPIHRIIPSSPFSKTGIDLAGPFITKPNVIRTKVTLKSYIALFICFSTKAIHLEIVSDLSTPTFLAAFRRFISRRGKPSDIFTDNATNFKGAKNILNNIHQLVKDSSIQSYVANEHITWHFIPPSAPNFGGIWEAGIKSLKYHLLRCLKSAVLNFEELNTLTSQIEACLNSRPLYPMSSDPNDFNPLTPGHFLIGRPLTALTEPSYHPNDNYLTRWKLIQKARDVFWQRWSREYLNNLQQRSKWKKTFFQPEGWRFGVGKRLSNAFNAVEPWPHHQGEKISPKERIEENSSKEFSMEFQRDADPPAREMHASLAAARDDVTPSLAASLSHNSAARAPGNWADCAEDLRPGADDGFTVVKSRKRRRESAGSPTAAEPSSNAGGSRTIRRPQSSAGSVPRAQEIRATRAHIAEARARQASSSEDHCVYLEHGPELEPFHYLKALDRMLGGTAGVIQVSKVNGHQLLGLANRGLAERLINEGLEVEGTLLRAERITVGNLPFFVEDSAIISALKPYGRVTSIAPKLMKAGPYTYNDGRREAFIVLREGTTTERLPTRLEIPIKGEAWPAYLSSGIKCSRCHGQGHRRANCPLLAGRTNAPRPATPTSPTSVPPVTAPGLPQQPSAHPPPPASPSPAMETPSASPAARAVTPSAAPRPSTPVAPSRTCGDGASCPSTCDPCSVLAGSWGFREPPINEVGTPRSGH